MSDRKKILLDRLKNLKGLFFLLLLAVALKMTLRVFSGYVQHDADWQNNSMFVMIILTIPLYFLIKEFFDGRAAFWGCIIFILLPSTNSYSWGSPQWPIFLFFFTCSIYFVQKSISSEKFYPLIIAGVCSCFSLYFNIMGIPVMVFILLTLFSLIIVKSAKKIHYMKCFAIWIILPFLFILAAFPLSDGKPVPLKRIEDISDEVRKISHSGFLNNYHRIYEEIKEMEEDPAFGRKGLYKTARHHMALMYLLRLLEHIAVTIFPLALIPLFLGARRSPMIEPSFMFIFLSLFFLFLYLNIIRTDHFSTGPLFMVSLMLFPFIGAGTEKIVRNVSEAYQSIKPGN